MMPYLGVEAMNHHLIQVSATVSPGAVVLLIIDGAGWHRSNQLVVPDNIVFLKLPPCAPELNPTENIWQYLRANALANSVWESYEAIVDACCNAWRGLIAKPEVITSIGTRQWAQVNSRATGLIRHVYLTGRLVLTNRTLLDPLIRRARKLASHQAARWTFSVLDPVPDHQC